MKHLLRDEYRIKQVTKVQADTLEALVAKLDGVDAARALETLRAFNAAVREDVTFDPATSWMAAAPWVVEPLKSNWANKLDTSRRYEAYAVTCGITFTFGGLGITTQAQVLDVDAAPIPGLYAAGEMVGGLFYYNYPGGTGTGLGRGVRANRRDLGRAGCHSKLSVRVGLGVDGQQPGGVDGGIALGGR